MRRSDGRIFITVLSAVKPRLRGNARTSILAIDLSARGRFTRTETRVIARCIIEQGIS